jgi:hypothetical protein
MNILTPFERPMSLGYADRIGTSRGLRRDHRLERHDDATGTEYTIDATPRFGLLGSTRVTIDESLRTTTLEWTASPVEIVTDIVLKYFMRYCERENGRATEHYTHAGTDVWRWSVASGTHELRATRHCDGQYDLVYRETTRFATTVW